MIRELIIQWHWAYIVMQAVFMWVCFAMGVWAERYAATDRATPEPRSEMTTAASKVSTSISKCWTMDPKPNAWCRAEVDAFSSSDRPDEPLLYSARGIELSATELGDYARWLLDFAQKRVSEPLVGGIVTTPGDDVT